MLMLYGMVTSHRERIIQLRRGDWSAIPVAYRKMHTAITIRSMLWFVSSVWYYSIVGFYIYMIVLLVIAVACAFLAACYGKWLPPDPASNSTEMQLLFGDVGRGITRALERYLLSLTIQTVISYGGAYLAIHTFLLSSWNARDGHAVTRNHSLYHLIDYIFIAASIPVVIVRLSYRVFGSVGLMFAFLARVDVPVFIGIGGDPGYVTYVRMAL